jgi:photosystem II stability/assembly factor-like uncharacterized protein
MVSRLFAAWVGYLFGLVLGLISFSARAQWTAQGSGLAGSATITAIDIVDANVVWAIAGSRVSPLNAFNQFTRTTNGGATWVPGSLGTSGRYPVGLSAVDANNAWVAMRTAPGNANGALFHTADGGQTWSQQPQAFALGSKAVGLHFFDLTHGVAIADPVGGIFAVYTTADGGATWQQVPATAMPAALTGEAGAIKTVVGTGGSIWFGTSAGRIFRSADEGLSWQVSSTSLQEIGMLSFNDELSGIAINDSFSYTDIRTTRDGGVTWKAATPYGAIGVPTYCAAIPGRPGTHVVGRSSPNTSQQGSGYTVQEGNFWVNIDAPLHSAVAFLNASTGWSGGGVSATSECIIYKGKVPEVGDCTQNLGGSTCDISQVQIVGTSLNTTASQCRPGQYLTTYPMTGNTTAQLLVGGSYQVRVTFARAMDVSIGFDVTGNGVIDGVDPVGAFANVPANTPVLFNFNINKFAGGGVNLLRIRATVPSPGYFGVGSCATLGTGETRDYFLSTGDFQNNSFSGASCSPGYYASGLCLGAYLQNVQLVGTTLNNASGCLPVHNASLPYTNYAAVGAATGTVQPGSTYTLSVTSPFSGRISAWFDWNRDNVFGPSEWFALPPPSGNNQPVSVAVPVPAGLALGPFRLRVRASGLGEANNATSACDAFQYGETEDYTLNAGIVSASKPEQAGGTVAAYPNPTADGELSLVWSETHGAARATFFNALGQRVQEQLLPARQLSQTLSIAQLPAGIYLLKINDPTGVKTLRVVKQ